MSKEKKKITICNIISLVLLIVITISSFFLTDLIYSSKENLDNYENHFYKYWSQNAQSNLNSLESKLELDINNNKIDLSTKDNIKNWLCDDSNLLMHSDNIDNFIITDIEYELDRNIDNFKVYLDSDQSLNNDTKKLIIKSYKSLLDDYSNTDFEKDKIIELIENYSKNIALETNMSYNDIREIMGSRIVGKERVIFSLTDSYTKEISSYEHKDKSFILNTKDDSLWVESITIPTGLLGIDGEPKFLMNGMANVEYNKISVYISVKESNALYSFNSYKESCNSIIIISEILLIIISIFSILIIILISIDVLRLNKNGGDINANKNH